MYGEQKLLEQNLPSWMTKPNTGKKGMELFPMHEVTSNRRFSSDQQRIRIYDSENEWGEPMVELEHAVKSSTMVITIWVAIIVLCGWMYIAVEHRNNPVLRYTVIPFAMWGVISTSCLIFRWQSRKLMMTGYLSFYRKSSSVWKISYLISSSSFVIGTAFFILSHDTWISRYPNAPHIGGMGEDARNLDILFFWWSIALGTLLILYGSLFFEFIQHNRRGRLPSGVSPSDYRALSDASTTRWASRRVSYSSPHKKSSSSERATLRRQATTIRYLEKQLKVLMDQVLVSDQQQRLTSDTDSVLYQEANEKWSQRLSQEQCEKQSLADECQAMRAKLSSSEGVIAGLRRQVETLNSVRAKLDGELVDSRGKLSKTQEKVNKLQILLAKEREAATQVRRLLEDLQPQQNSMSERRSRRRRGVGV